MLKLFCTCLRNREWFLFAQKIKFFIKDFFSECDQIRSFQIAAALEPPPIFIFAIPTIAHSWSREHLLC